MWFWLPAAIAATAPAPSPSPEVALEGAVACFEAVDYDCAEEKLAVAWGAGTLRTEDAVRGRVIEAQIALARRDEAHARRAVTAILALDPTYVPDPRLPAHLRELIDQERPPEPAFFRPVVRADVTSWRLFGQDGDRWSDGLGFEGAAGGLFRERWQVELGYSYSDHRPLTYDLSGLTMAGVFAGGSVRLPAGFLVVSPGLVLGATHVAAEGVTGSEAYWGFRTEVPLELSAEIWNGVGIGARVGLDMLIVRDGNRAAFSWILPLQAGLRGVF